MRSNILLAIDVPAGPLPDITAMAGLIRVLVKDGGGQVIVLHVQEFSIALLAVNMLDQGGASGRRAVDAHVAGLRAAGVHARGLIREADFGHVARVILDAAEEFEAQVIVLGPRKHQGSPHLPASGVAAHVLRLATRPVLVMPAGLNQVGKSHVHGRVRSPVMQGTTDLSPLPRDREKSSAAAPGMARATPA